MSLPSKERHAIEATVAAVVVLVGLTITQYVRTSWPFTEGSPGTVPGSTNASQGMRGMAMSPRAMPR